MEEIRNSMPQIQIHAGLAEINVKDVVKYFHPRDKDYREANFDEEYREAKFDKDYREAKFDEEYITRKETSTRYHIPEHQRFYVWSKKHEIDLIDSILRNYPIPDVIVSDTDVRGLFHQEDGQQRFTALWRYYHNLFPYIPSEYSGDGPPPNIYYSEVPENAPSNSYKLEEVSIDAKNQLDNYRIYIKEIKTEDGLNNRKEIICDIFERLNSGKQLSDGDKVWNRKETPVVKCALDMGLSEDILPLLKRVFNIDIRNIMQPRGRGPSKKPLCSMVGMVLGLSTPMDNENWGNVMTTSYPKINTYLYNEVTNIPHIKDGLITISRILDENRGSDQISAASHASFNRHLGIMIYDWRQRVQEYNCELTERVSDYVIEEYSEFWIPIIEYFQNSEFDLDHPSHPITSLYVGGDRKNKNTDIGANIRSRHTQLMIKVNEWDM